jgi:hypothetical protein
MAKHKRNDKRFKLKGPVCECHVNSIMGLVKTCADQTGWNQQLCFIVAGRLKLRQHETVSVFGDLCPLIVHEINMSNMRKPHFWCDLEN